jgi:hypothetical protein
MLTQTVMWTTLPNGIVGDSSNRRLRVSVYVSPRLQTDPGQSLALFPDFCDWPAHLQPGKVTFAAYISNLGPMSKPIGPIPAIITSQPPNLALWTALFPPSSSVASYTFDDLTHAPVSSYPVAGMLRQLKAGYQAILAESPVDMPRSGTRRQALPGPYAALHGSPAVPPAPPVPAGASTPEADLIRAQAAMAETLLRSDGGSTLAQRLSTAVATARQLAQLRSPGTFTSLLPHTGSAVSYWTQFVAFHRPPVSGTPSAAQGSATVLDFHRALAALSDYPDLLRLLGLVIDLELPEASVQASPANGSTMQIQIVPTFSAPLSGAPPYTPWTAYILEGDRFFVPAPGNTAQPESVYGLLNLQLTGPDPDAQTANPPPINLYDLIQVDVDGMAFKAINMAGTDGNGSDGSTADDAAGVPTVRTSGIALMRAGQAAVLSGRFSTALTNNSEMASKPVTLYAEDLMRGYRIDVHDAQSGLWHSLHQRTGSYTFKTYPGGPHAVSTMGEGTAQTALTRPTQQNGSPDPSGPIYIHESLAHWQGWSLSVPRPGKTISDTGTPTTVTSEAPPDGFQLDVAFEVQPGTLPRLRYGQNYQLRARTVDPAGNSLSLQEADALLALLQTLQSPLPILPTSPSDFTYRRFEPVSAPIVVLREKLTEGESLHHLVIRSNYNEPAATCAQRLMSVVAKTRPNDKVIYTAVNERHLVPPKIALAAVEAHGLLDASFGTQTPTTVVDATYNMARKEKGRLSDTTIIDTATGQPVPIPDTTGIDPLTGQTITRPSVEYIVTGTSNNQPAGYAIHHEPQVRLPYLPDLLSRGAALFGLPGLAPGQGALLAPNGTLTIGPSLLPQTALTVVTSNTQIDFGTAWPERLPFRLQLAEQPDPNRPPAPPSWDSVHRVLTVYLAKAEQVTVRLASFLGDAHDLDLLGIWSWLVEQLQAGGKQPDPNTIQTALAGAMWMLTPFHQLTLVHAVQQPLVAPALQAVSTPRGPGATFAYFGATVHIHGKSTAKLDVLASWTEQIDDPVHMIGPCTCTATAYVFDVPIQLPDGATALPNPLKMNPVPVASYDATKDVVTFLIPPPAGAVTPQQLSSQQTSHTLPNGNSGNGGPHKPPGNGGNGASTIFLSRHEFGDTKYRRVGYQVVATTRFREYFPPEITSDPSHLTLSGSVVPIDVPSTARPAAPQVLRVLPIFSWNRPPAVPGQPRTITRRSAGVRVYLERPWYSSGDGELLGVVLANPASYPPSDRLRPFASQWGNDPIWGTGGMPGAPQPTDFPLTQKVGQNLTLEELVLPDGTWADNEKVLVAGHAVAYDGTLWYSDIQLIMGDVYSPFVRLALARYQPHALPGMELSRVMLSDFVQIMPQRTVTITPAADSSNRYTVQVDGLTYQSNSWVPNDADADAGPDTQFLPPLPSTILPVPNLIEVSVEQRIPGASDEAGWQATDTSQAGQIEITSAALAGAHFSPGAPLWKGDVSLPGDRTPGQFRIVIKELEQLADDTSFTRQLTSISYGPPPSDLPPGEKPHPPVKGPIEVTFFPGVRRVVFAETIEL